MKLEYELILGYTRNLLVDIPEERIYYLPKEEDNLEKVLSEYTDLRLEDTEDVPAIMSSNSYIDILECRVTNDYLQLMLEMAKEFLCDYVIFYSHTLEEYTELAERLSWHQDHAELSFRRIHIVVDDHIFDQIQSPPSNLFYIISHKLFLERRKIKLSNFIVNQEVMIEGKTQNTFYHKRLIVDSGNFTAIKREFLNNIPVRQKLDNIQRVSGISAYWHISKEQVVVCRDCEYRLLCVDASGLEQVSGGLYARKSECPYNPYVGKWKEEEGYRTLQECVEDKTITLDYMNRPVQSGQGIIQARSC